MSLSESQISMIKKAADYRGRKVKFAAFRPGMSLNSYWNSGCRDYFYFVNLKSGQVSSVPQNGTPYDSLNLKAESLPENTVLAEKVIINGRAAALYVYS